MKSAAADPTTHAEAVGRLLQRAFGQILSHFPTGVNKVADVARWLDLDRSICQRIVLGLRDASDGLGVLERFPGVRGLEQFIDAAVSRGCPDVVSDRAEHALAEYAQLVSDAGGSQTRLVGRLEAMRAQRDWRRDGPVAPSELEKWRRRAYESAVALTGLASAARVELVIVGPPSNGQIITDTINPPVTTVTATAMIGIEAAAHAMPLTRRSRIAGKTPVPLAGAHGGFTPDLLLRPFTSDPPPRVTTRTEGEYLIQLFNIETPTSAPCDIAAGVAMNWNWGTPANAEGDADFYSVGRIIGPPTRRVVLDVYLHRSLPAPRSVSAHVLRPATQGALGNARPQSRWFDRLPFDHDLLLLGGTPGTRPSEAYARLGDLTHFLIDTLRWNEESFSGYRFEVAYPVFDMEYVIAAEF